MKGFLSRAVHPDDTDGYRDCPDPGCDDGKVTVAAATPAGVRFEKQTDDQCGGLGRVPQDRDNRCSGDAR